MEKKLIISIIIKQFTCSSDNVIRFTIIFFSFNIILRTCRIDIFNFFFFLIQNRIRTDNVSKRLIISDWRTDDCVTVTVVCWTVVITYVVKLLYCIVVSWSTVFTSVWSFFRLLCVVQCYYSFTLITWFYVFCNNQIFQ